jgi:hypothetical protein
VISAETHQRHHEEGASYLQEHAVSHLSPAHSWFLTHERSLFFLICQGMLTPTHASSS